MSTEAEVNLSFYLQDTEENNSTDELPLSVEDAKPTKVCVYCVYCVYCVLYCVCVCCTLSESFSTFDLALSLRTVFIAAETLVLKY